MKKISPSDGDDDDDLTPNTLSHRGYYHHQPKDTIQEVEESGPYSAIPSTPQSRSHSDANTNHRSDHKPKLYVRVEPMVKPTRSIDPTLNSLVYVNDDQHPILINNEHFTGHLVFRVRNFHGWTPLDERTNEPRPPISDCPHYFAGHKRTFSLQLSGRFRKQWTGDDIMFGTFFKKPLALPRGSGLALAFAQRIDPSMRYEANTDTPYVCSPIICAMNTINIQPLLAPPMASGNTGSNLRGGNSGPSSISALGRASLRKSANLRSSVLYETAVRSQLDTEREPLTLPEWTYGGKHEILEENVLSAFPTWAPPTAAISCGGGDSESISGITTPTGTSTTADAHYHSLAKVVAKNKTGASHRRTWFLDEKHRKRFIFHPDTVYSFDFASPYVDMNEIVLKMGINIHVAKYLDGQPVRYECRTRDGSILFWALELGLK